MKLKHPLAWSGIAAAFAAGLWLYSCLWYSPAMRARVATPDGKPVAGAIVVASWNIEAALNGASLGQLALAETVTDGDGWFSVPAWGPRLLLRGAIPADEPTVRVFKPGHVPLVLRNSADVAMDTAPLVNTFRWQDRTVPMPPFSGTPAQYDAALEPLVRSLDVLYRGNDFCYWRQTPRLLLALQQQKLQLAPHGAGQSLYLAHQYAGTATRCGNAEQFFSGFYQ